MPRHPAPARGDHWNADVAGNQSGEFEFKAIARAIRIHGIDHNFTRTKVLGAFGPGQCIHARAFAKPAYGNLVAARTRVHVLGFHRVHAQHDALGAKCLGTLGNDSRLFDGKRVDRHFFCPGQQHPVHIIQFRDAAADGKRNADVTRHLLHHLDINRPAFCRGRDIVDDELVATPLTIGHGHLDGITQIDVVLELDAFRHFFIAHVEAGNDAFG